MIEMIIQDGDLRRKRNTTVGYIYIYAYIHIHMLRMTRILTSGKPDSLEKGLLFRHVVSSSVKTGSKNDVPFDTLRSRLHLLEQRGVAHHSSCVHQLTALLIQPHNTPDYGSFHDIRHSTDLVKRYSNGPVVHHLQHF